jgi:hypothetical protein
MIFKFVHLVGKKSFALILVNQYGHYMITKLQQFLFRHRKWLIAILIIALLPFVFTVSAIPGIGRSDGGKKRSFFGINLNSPENIWNWQRSTVLSIYLDGLENIQMEKAMLARAAWGKLANIMQAPTPNNKQLEEFIHARKKFSDACGTFSNDLYDEFLREINAKDSKIENFVANTMSDDWRMQLIANTLVAADLSFPIEAKTQARQMMTKWTLREATLPFDSFNPEIQMSDDDLFNFFSAHRERYSEPEQICIDAIFFKNTCNTDAVNIFINTLYEQNHETNLKELANAARNIGGIVKQIGPFSKRNQHEITDIPQEVLLAAFDVVDEQIFSDPIHVTDGIYVILLRNRIAEKEQPFENVRTLVKKHYMQRELVRMFAQHAREVRSKLIDQLKNGDDFSRAATENGFVVGDLTTITFDSLQDDAQLENMSVILKLNKGEISEFVPQKPNLKLWHIVVKDAPNDSMIAETTSRIATKNTITSGRMLIQRIIEEQISNELDGL